MRKHPEVLLISAVIRNGAYPQAQRAGASHRLFHLYSNEWQWIGKQFEKNRKTPERTSFRHQFPEFQLIKTDDVLTAVDLVKKTHARYVTQGLMEQAVSLMEAGEEQKAVQLISTGAGELQYEIEHNADAVDVVTDWMDTYDEVLARVDRAQESGSAGVPTGIRSLDIVTGGMQDGWLVTFAARLGVGKTFALIQCGLGAVTSGYDCLFFSLEQNRHQVAYRMQSLLASSLGYELNPNALSTGKGFSTTKYKQILEEIEEGTTGRFLINDASRGRVGTGAVAAAIEAKQPDIVIIDYLTLMQTYGADKWQGVAQLSGDLKVMAENYAVPIVVASQFNRAGTGKDPGPENLSQSDAVGQDSDLIIAITKRSEHLRNMRMIKNRHGSSDVAWPMHFDPAKGIFQEITGKDADRIEDADKDED